MSSDHPSPCGACRATEPAAEPASGIGRRTFIAQGAIMAAMAALAACGVAASDATAPTLSGSTTIRVSDYPALSTVGGIALVTIASSPFAVVRTGSSTFVALSRICPHQGSTVNPSGSGFLCPNHGAQFSSTGVWLGGQPTSNMRSYATAYDAAAGTVTVG